MDSFAVVSGAMICASLRSRTFAVSSDQAWWSRSILHRLNRAVSVGLTRQVSLWRSPMSSSSHYDRLSMGIPGISDVLLGISPTSRLSLLQGALCAAA